MPVVGVKNFVGDRLSQAKKARGLSSVNLADLIGVSPTSISLYEKGTQNPKQEIVEHLSKVLNVPVGYFFKEISIRKPANLFYRSMSSATKLSRTISEAKYEWTLEIIDYALNYFIFPEFNLPDVDVPEDFRKLDSFAIESIANQVRDIWTLGSGPISNMVRTLESNGVIVWRTLFEAETQDAFSEFRIPHPIVVLSSDKNNYFRSRFDAAHELGHLILHRNVDRSVLNKSRDFKIIEEQAHLFAGAFLLPATAYSSDLWDVSIDAFRSLKPRWNISIAMQIMRSKQLKLINDDQEKRLWINLSRRKWRKSEPLDDSTPVEMPKLLSDSIKMLVEEKVKTGEQLVDELQISATDIEKIIERPGFIRSANESYAPSLKRDPGNNVVPFKR